MGKTPPKKVVKIVAKSKPLTRKVTIEPTTEPTITVWIHGTQFIANHIMRKFFYRPDGLHHVSVLGDGYHLRTIAHTLNQSRPEEFPFDNFFVFGWSGSLSFEERKKEGEKLYQSLRKLVADFKEKHNVEPQLRIITHSHGGNVALNMAHLEDIRAPQLRVHQLIFLACPVQTETSDLTQHPMFERIYSFHSTLDFVQILDPQGAYPQVRAKTRMLSKVDKQPLFSERCFEPNPKIRQAQIKVNGRGLTHVEFILQRFLTLLPDIVDEADSWDDSEQIRLVTLRDSE